MIRALIFDYYGVIQVDQMIVWLEMHSSGDPEVLRQVDDISRRLDLGFIDEPQYFTEIAALHNISARQFQEETDQLARINQPLLEFVREVKNRSTVITAIASNDSSKLRQTVARNGVGAYFDNVYVSADMQAIKPYPEFYEHIQHDLNLKPGEIIFFDDRPDNITGAAASGWQSHLYQNVAQVRQLVDMLLS